jgi:nucleoside-diphosphate-sugar epimerase
LNKEDRIRGKNIFITGGAGFIASHLIERLIGDNKVIIYDNLLRNAFQYTSVKKHPNLTFIKGDVLDYEGLNEAMKGADICVHAAAIAGIFSVGKKATLTMKVNFIGAYHALEAAVRNKVKRFIDFSTSEVYGPFVYRGKETDSTTLGPVGEKRWVYAISKLAGEHFAHTYALEYGIDVVTVRPFNVYGPRQVGEGAIEQMVTRAVRNERITVFNEGTQIRSWCYVRDFIDALYAAIHLKDARNQVFNIGNPQATTTVLGLAEKIIAMTKSASKIVFKTHPGSEVEMRIPDIDKSRTILRFEPKVSLEEGLRKSINWYKNHLEIK